MAPSKPPHPDDELLRPVAHLRAKAAALLLFTLTLIVGSALYLMYARGVFEPTQRLILLADDSEGVAVGMDVTFSGFPIGRVRGLRLAEGGEVRIAVDVSRRDAHWLRESSVFTLVRGLVGGTTIKAYSGVLSDPPLPDGAVRPVLRGDATAEIPRLMAEARELLENLTQLTAADSALGGAMGNVRTLTERLNAPGGVLSVLTGSDAESRQVLLALQRSNQLLARLDGMAARIDGAVARVDGMVARADRQVLGSGADAGLVAEVRAAVLQLNALLGDARRSMAKVDAVLAEAQAVGANTREATAGLGELRAEVEANLRKVEGLLAEINRKWPFARDAELKLP